MSNLTVKVDEETHQVALDPTCGDPLFLHVNVDGQDTQVILPQRGRPVDEIEWVIIDGRPHEIGFDEQLHWIRDGGSSHQVQIQESGLASHKPSSLALSHGVITAPIPGRIAQIMVSPGQVVEACQPVIILEAMKMENEIRAPCAGTVESISVQVGQCVGRNTPLAAMR